MRLLSNTVHWGELACGLEKAIIPRAGSGGRGPAQSRICCSSQFLNVAEDGAGE